MNGRVAFIWSWLINHVHFDLRSPVRSRVSQLKCSHVMLIWSHVLPDGLKEGDGGRMVKSHSFVIYTSIHAMLVEDIRCMLGSHRFVVEED